MAKKKTDSLDVNREKLRVTKNKSSLSVRSAKKNLNKSVAKQAASYDLTLKLNKMS